VPSLALALILFACAFCVACLTLAAPSIFCAADRALASAVA